MNTDRFIDIKTAILRELVNTPRDFMLPDKDLRGGVNLSMEKPPTETEWQEVILILEQRERLIAREESEVRCTSLWYIKPLGRRHATELGIE